METFIHSCETCGKTFKHYKRYQTHIKTVECDLICEVCNYEAKSRSTLYRHKKRCKEEQAGQVTNNNNINNIDSSANANVGTVNNNNVNNNNNVVLLQPFDVDHYYMKKTDMLGPAQKTVVDFLLNEQYYEAYECLFEHIHGNLKYPEHHNIYLPHLDKNQIAVFKGKNFKYVAADKQLPRLFSRLRFEMGWLVKDYDELDEKQTDQLLWDIHAHWMNVNEQNDPFMKQVLRNNKNVVMDTIENKIVRPDKAMITKVLELTKDEYHIPERKEGVPPKKLLNKWIDPGLEDLDENHIVKLP